MHDEQGHQVRPHPGALSDQELATRAELAIRGAADRLGMTVPLVHVIAGWGDVFYVTIHVHATPMQGRDQAERVFVEAADTVLAPRRQLVKFSWIR